MQIVVEENCKLDGNYKKFIESFVKELIIKFDINTLEMFVIASNDVQKFEKTIIEYSQKLGKADISLDGEPYALWGKNLTSLTNGELWQIVVVKEAAIKFLVSALTEGSKRTANDLDEELIISGGQLVLHEIGHAYDNEQRLRNNCYLEGKQEYDLSKEYRRYLLDASSALYGEYRAEYFAGQLLQKVDLLKQKEEYLIECISNQLENYVSAVERAYRITYLFMHYLAHCKKNEERIGERFEKGIQKEYIEILEKLCDEVKKIDARYPKLETETDFNNFSMIYSEIINLVSDEIN